MCGWLWRRLGSSDSEFQLSESRAGPGSAVAVAVSDTAASLDGAAGEAEGSLFSGLLSRLQSDRSAFEADFGLELAATILTRTAEAMFTSDSSTD